VLSSFGYRPPS